MASKLKPGLIVARMTTPPPIAEQLRTAIAAWSGTRQQLADAADVSKALLDKFMTDRNRGIRLEEAEKIGKALGLPSFKLK
jgi:DNA-binding Xre family transcriptional regulator